MPLTALSNDSVALSCWAHHLPQLRSFRSLTLTESLAAAPQLQRLVLSCYDTGDVNNLLSLAQQWWRRMGCPPLLTNGSINKDEWQRHSADNVAQPLERSGSLLPAPLIRELIVNRGCEPFNSVTFPYLALLPHLRLLVCALLAKDLPALGLLPQLEELRLRSVSYDNSRIVEPLADSSLRTLGGLPLSRLHTLRLHNVDEREGECVIGDTLLFGNEPDFPWGGRPPSPRSACRGSKSACWAISGSWPSSKSAPLCASSAPCR